MDINNLYILAEKDRIGVEDFSLAENKSLAVHIDGICSIALDEKKLKKNSEKKTALAHEMGHCETYSFYNQYSTADVRSKHEYTANKWAVEHLLPKDEMLSAIKKGYTEIWQIAELFDVEEWLVKKALYIYFDKQEFETEPIR